MKKQDNLTAADLSDLGFEEIDNIQASIDESNIAIIRAAFNQGQINESEKDYLEAFYGNGMDIYRNIYHSLYETFGAPLYTTGYNPKTGEIDYDEKGQPIDHTLKVLTPFVYTKLKFLDKNNNAIFVILPKMKTAERAIQKLDKEFGKEYFNNIKNAIELYFTEEDANKRTERVQNIPNTTSQLHDILRLTITCKYLHDIKRIMRKLHENENSLYIINPNETRDRFEKPLDENEKKYYDIKMILHQKTPQGIFDVELQLKLDTLFYGDIRTHHFYEKRRRIEAESSPQDPPSIKELNNQSIRIFDELCKTINQNAIHQYNMMVLDKIFRIEDNVYRSLRIKPDNADGTYNKCINFIKDNYLIESYDNFDAKNAFSENNFINKACYLKMIGALPPNYDEISENAPEEVEKTFKKLDKRKIERFQKINDVAQRYQSTIQSIIDNRKKKDKQPRMITPQKRTR